MVTEYKLSTRRPDGSIDIAMLAEILAVSEAELAESIGANSEPVAAERGKAPNEEQERLFALVDLIERLTPTSGDPRTAYDWYCSHPIAGYGGETAQDLVKSGRLSALAAHLDRIADGGYA